MTRKSLCALLAAAALLSSAPAQAWGEGYGWRHGRYWGGRGAWHGGYGWDGRGYYAAPYGWPAGHGGSCWRWWYGQWVWAC